MRRYEVEMTETTKFVIEAKDFIQAAEYISKHRIHEIEKDKNIDLIVKPNDKILGKTIMPADIVLKD